MRRRFEGKLPLPGLCSLVLAACGAPGEAVKPRPPLVPGTAAAVAAPQVTLPSPRYVLTRSPGSGANAESGHAIFGGVRYSMQGGVPVRAQTTAEPSLVGFARVPEHLGGGFLFWNSRALYRAPTFTGDLEPFIDLVYVENSVSFGPDFFMVHTELGSRVLDAKTGRLRAPFVPGLQDVVSLADGRAIAVTATGDALATRDAGKHWQSVRARLLAPVESIREAEGDLWFVERQGEALRFAQSGEFCRQLLPKQQLARASDPRWTLQHGPFEEAAASGIPGPSGRALVPVNGAVASVELESGALRQWSPTSIPGARQCKLLAASPAPLLVCTGRAVSVLADPLGWAKLERSFPAETKLAFADGVLVVGASCTGDVEPGQVCIRDAAGRYTNFDRRKELAAFANRASDDGAKPIEGIEWIPKRGGGAVGFKRGNRPFLLDVVSGTLLGLTPERGDALAHVLASSVELCVTTRMATESGKIVGYLPTGSFSMRPDGSLEPTPFEFQVLRSAGARALAVAQDSRYFESSDYGQTFREVEGPPGKGNPEACSEVGCRAANWVRLGWGPAAPRAEPVPRVVPSPPIVEQVPRPLLACHEQGAPRGQLRPLEDNLHPEGEGFGARRLLLQVGDAEFVRELYAAPGWSDPGLFALTYGSPPEIPDSSTWPRSGSTVALDGKRTTYYVNAFDPEGRVETARTSWRALVEAALRSGAPFPNLLADDQAEQPVLAVAAAPPLYTDGLLLLGEGPETWVHQHGQSAPTIVALGRNLEDDMELKSAISPRAGELLVLVADRESRAQVIAVGKSLNEKRHRFEGVPDALALGAAGEVAAFVGPLGIDPPTQGDPAQLLLLDGSVRVLPPWSTLKPATAPECAARPDDYRVLLATPRAWLAFDPQRGAFGDSEAEGMLALVRVNAERFCLDAVDLPVGSDADEIGIPTRVVARFAGSPSAGRVGVTLGAEFRQALTCELR